MINHSTKDTSAFLLTGIFYGVIAMVYYRSLLFRCFPNMTYGGSKALLWGMLAASLLTGVVVFWYRKTAWSLAASILLPYGIYTAFTYLYTVPVLFRVVLAFTAVCSLAYTLLRMSRKIEHPKYRGLIIKNRLYQCFCISQYLLSAGLAAVMLVLIVSRIFGSAILTSSVKPTAASESSGQTISNNMDTILLLQQEEWETLETREKLDVLQTVANIEANHLGISNELNVCASTLGDNVLGSYRDDTHTIYIDLEHLENNSADEVLNTCCHEAYHSYQYRLIDAYTEASESARNLQIFETAVLYAEEFENYQDGDDEFCLYYNQSCEADAREYAAAAVEEYDSRIEEYLKEHPEADSNR